jgi:hypothetical protein
MSSRSCASPLRIGSQASNLVGVLGLAALATLMVWDQASVAERQEYWLCPCTFWGFALTKVEFPMGYQPLHGE